MICILEQPMAKRVPIIGDRAHAHHTRDRSGAETEDRMKKLSLVERISGISHGTRKGGQSSQGPSHRVSQGSISHARQGAPQKSSTFSQPRAAVGGRADHILGWRCKWEEADS